MFLLLTLNKIYTTAGNMNVLPFCEAVRPSLCRSVRLPFCRNPDPSHCKEVRPSTEMIVSPSSIVKYHRKHQPDCALPTLVGVTVKSPVYFHHRRVTSSHDDDGGNDVRYDDVHETSLPADPENDDKNEHMQGDRLDGNLRQGG